MAPALTLHHGDQQAEYVEHPTEVARKALLAAAGVEEDARPADQMRRFAKAMPDRPAILKGGES